LGGAGADVFVFDKGDNGTTSTAMDVVADFEVGVDTLRLQGVNSADVSVSVQAGDTVVSYTNSSGETQFIRVENTTLTIGDIDGLL
jgi:Ca2+-binding RTX toxin-like protein